MSHSLGLARVWVYSFSSGGFLTCTLLCLTIYSSSSPRHSVIVIESLCWNLLSALWQTEMTLYFTPSHSLLPALLSCVWLMYDSQKTHTHTLRLSALINPESVCYWMQQYQPSAARLTLVSQAGIIPLLPSLLRRIRKCQTHVTALPEEL